MVEQISLKHSLKSPWKKIFQKLWERANAKVLSAMVHA